MSIDLYIKIGISHLDFRLSIKIRLSQDRDLISHVHSKARERIINLDLFSRVAVQENPFLKTANEYTKEKFSSCLTPMMNMSICKKKGAKNKHLLHLFSLPKFPGS